MHVQKYIPETYQPMNSRFRIPSPIVGSMDKWIEFEWDGCAMGPNGEITLIEHEGNSIVNIHIQGHVSRVSLMLSKGFNIRTLVWVCKKEQFSRLWNLAESWKRLLCASMKLPMPVFEYRNLDGGLMAFSDEINGKMNQENN